MDYETRNPFRNGRVISTDTDPQVYRDSQGDERGQVGHIMGSHELRDFWVCPHRWLNGWHSDDSTAKDWGLAVECLALQPERFKKQWAVKPETYPAPKDHAKVRSGELQPGDPLDWNARAKPCADWEREHKGKSLIKSDTYLDALAAVAVLMESPECGEYIGISVPQVFLMAEYADDETGVVVPVKCMLDMLPNPTHPAYGKTVGDLKTVENASLPAWQSAIKKYRHHWQAAMYLWICQVTPDVGERLDFRHICQESYFPYEVAPYLMTLEHLELGRVKVLAALKAYAQCLKEGKWPGYTWRMNTIIKGWGAVEPTQNLINFED